jgi:PAS domain S-box-containing protein
MKESSFLDANQLVGYASGNKELNSNILLSDIARTLIKSTSLSEKLNAIISLTGKALNVSRVYIFEDDLERAVTNNAYEWCNVGIEPEIENLQNFPIALAQDWYDIIGSQGYISAHDIRQLPPSIIKILEPQNIVSIIVFRLMLPTGTSGFVGFDECREKRYWSNYEIEVLQAINGIIISLYENDYLSKKLHDSNINFYNMFNSIADFMFVADTEGFLIEGNLALHERTIFKSLKEAGNKIHIIDMHPQKYKKEVEKIIKQMVKGEIDSCTLPLLDSDGYEIEVNTKVWRGYWDNKEVLLGISKDISKEVVALEMFNKLFDNNPLAVLVVDVEQRRITRINNSFEKIFDYTIEEIDNLDIDNLQIWTDREYAKGFLDLIAKDQNLRSIPITLKKRNGQFLNGVLSTTAIDIQGKKQITAVFTDLSEQIELQERLAEQKQRLEHIITSSDMGTWEWDLETDETIFNEKWAEMVGYKLKDLEPTTIHTWRNLLHPADIRCTEEELNKYFRGESPFYSIESRMRHKNGSYRWIYDTGKVVEYNNLGKPKKMFGSHLDISKIKMAEEQLFEAKLKAEKESESKSKFLANVSHEIRTPIHTMQGITEMLAKTKLTDKQKTYALYLQQSSNILLEAIHNILDFTKIEANKIDLHNHKFLLNDVVDSIINMFAFRFAQKGLTFLINVDCSTPLDLFGDYYKLSQILQNLLSNAEKFTPKGTVTLKIEPEKQLKNTVMLKFSVIDTGYGIDAEMIPKIFDSYVQDQKLMAKSGTVGSGLGLFIVEQLVTLLDGEITVESIKDEGTTFSVIVPFKVNSEFKIKTIYTENWVEPNCQIVIDDSPTGQIIKNSFDSLGIKYKNIVQKLNNSKNASLIAIFDWELAVKEKRVDLILEKMKREGDKIFYIVSFSLFKQLLCRGNGANTVFSLGKEYSLK